MNCPHCKKIIPFETARDLIGYSLGNPNISNSALARQYGLSRERVRQIRAEDYPDVKFRVAGRISEIPLRERAFADLRNTDLSHEEVAVRHGVKKSTVRSERSRDGIRISSNIVRKSGADLANVDIISTELARKIGFTPSAVRYARKRCYPGVKFKDGRADNKGRPPLNEAQDDQS